jgi:hypothetical protein
VEYGQWDEPPQVPDLFCSPWQCVLLCGGAVGKPALDLFIVVNMAVDFLEISNLEAMGASLPEESSLEESSNRRWKKAPLPSAMQSP